MKLFPVMNSRIPTAWLLLFKFVFFLVPLLYSGCDRKEEAPRISLTDNLIIERPQQGNTPPDVINIAIAAMISPQETYVSYKALIKIVSEKLGQPIKIVQRKTYQEVNDLIEQKLIDAAFVCTGAYVTGHDKFGMELLVAPVVNDAPLYYSYIIVNKNSNFKDLEALEGHKFAFTDPMSNTGHSAPIKMLAGLDQSPENFFSETLFTYSHDNSIKAVAHKIVDGAAVDSLVWDYLNKKGHHDTLMTKIILKSSPYGIPPVVVHPETDRSLKKKLAQIFLEMHNSETGRKILQEIMIERFVEVNDDIYDSARKISTGTVRK